ncbi:MAG TPA: hypothetical protein VFF63_08735 [Candidatus Babeliales bacterium]|nr:hypothetical protein [Candidatus Babeliales bacterium]
MKKTIGALFISLAAAGFLAACNSGSSSSAPPGTGTNCGGPPNQLEVLYPIPGTTSAPAALGNIYVSTSGSLPPSNSFDFFLVQENGGSTFTSTFFGISKSQIPLPHASPSYPNAVYYASSLPSSYFIGPAQAVSLYWNDGGTGCTPHVLVSSFSTVQ